MISFLRGLLGGSKLSNLESQILACVRDLLDPQIAAKWDSQVRSINKVQRLPDGVEVDFYCMKGGRPAPNPEFAFPNKAEELQIARIQITAANAKHKLVATVWSVTGFLFCIEYEGSANYFEEAAAMDPPLKLKLDCKLTADLAAG